MPKGIIKVTRELLVACNGSLDEVFKDAEFKVIKSKDAFDSDHLLVLGECDKFEEVKEGQNYPYYYISTTKSNGNTTYDIVRV